MRRRLLGLVGIVVLIVSILSGCACSSESKVSNKEDLNTNLYNATTKVADDSEGVASFKMFSDKNYYNGGRSAYSTVLKVNEDGTFTLRASYILMGDSQPTAHVTNSSGKLNQLVKLDENTYKTTIESIEYETKADENINGWKTVYESGNLKPNDEVYFYMPGKSVSEIDNAFIKGISEQINAHGKSTDMTVLDFYGVYIPSGYGGNVDVYCYYAE